MSALVRQDSLFDFGTHILVEDGEGCCNRRVRCIERAMKTIEMIIMEGTMPQVSQEAP